MTTKTKYPIEFVEWIDSASHSTWRNVEDSKVNRLSIYTIAFVVHEDDESITMSHSIHEVEDGDNVMDPVTIPKAAILSRYKVTFT